VSPVVGQRMIRTDDGMRGTVELVQVPGFVSEFERRVVYLDRGEKRVAGKREVWEAEKDPPRRLRDEEIQRVASAADRALRALDKNEPVRWWQSDIRRGSDEQHDHALVTLITDYLRKRA
jgi:hypothetical protein